MVHLMRLELHLMVCCLISLSLAVMAFRDRDVSRRLSPRPDGDCAVTPACHPVTQSVMVTTGWSQHLPPPPTLLYTPDWLVYLFVPQPHPDKNWKTLQSLTHH